MWLEDALKLTYLQADKEQWHKFERAAMKWLRRYVEVRSPALENFAQVCRTYRLNAHRLLQGTLFDEAGSPTKEILTAQLVRSVCVGTIGLRP